MHRLPVDSLAFEMIVNASESCSLSAIKRCSLLNARQRERLQDVAMTPASLKQQSRLLIRRLLSASGPFVVEKIEDLPIPRLTQDYLLYAVY